MPDYPRAFGTPGRPRNAGEPARFGTTADEADDAAGRAPRPAVRWVLVALFALAGFTAMHAVAISDLSPGHTLPDLGGAHAQDPAVLSAAPSDPGDGAAAPRLDPGGWAEDHGRAAEHGSHEHALLGCLIALTGLGLLHLRRQSGSGWLGPRAPTQFIALSRSSAAALVRPGFVQLRLRVLRI